MTFAIGGGFTKWMFWAVVFLTLQPLLTWFASFGVPVPLPTGGISTDGWRVFSRTWRSSSPTSSWDESCRRLRHFSYCAPFWTPPPVNIRCRRSWRRMFLLGIRRPST